MTEERHTPPTRVALIGYGLAGKAFHAPLIRATLGLELIAVISSRTAEIAADLPGVAVLETLERALDDPAVDLVVIATPDQLHHPQALAALSAGKHVVVDKPFAPSLPEAREMAAQAERAGKLLAVFHNRRWDADFLTLKDLIVSGELGEIRQFESHFDRFRPAAGDRWKDRRASGVWQDLGPHLVDQAIQLFGMPSAVLADLAVQRPGGTAFNYAHVLLDQGPVKTILHMTQSAVANSLRFAVHGTRGSYVKHGLDPQEDQSKAGIAPGDADWAIDPLEGELTRSLADGTTRTEAVANQRGDYLAFYRKLRTAIADGGTNPVPPEQALKVMAILAAGSESAVEQVWTAPTTEFG